jgi:hypothetical protein
MWMPAALIPARLARDPWPRHLAARAAFSTIAAAVLVAAPGLVSAVVEWADVQCLLRTVSGWPCPGCGITTSLVALAAGDPGGAVRANAAGPVVAVALVAQAMLAWRGVRDGGERFGRAWLARLDGLVVAALALAWVARLWGAR